MIFKGVSIAVVVVDVDITCQFAGFYWQIPRTRTLSGVCRETEMMPCVLIVV